MGCGRIHLALKPLWECTVLLPAVTVYSQMYYFCRTGREWFQLGLVSSNLHRYLPSVARLYPPCFYLAWKPFSVHQGSCVHPFHIFKYT